MASEVLRTLKIVYWIVPTVMMVKVALWKRVVGQAKGLGKRLKDPPAESVHLTLSLRSTSNE